MLRKVFLGPILGALCLILGTANAWAVNCSPNPFTLANGVIADATQVMANFNNLVNCANTILGKFTGPASSADGDVVCFSGTTGQSGKACASGVWTTYTPTVTCGSGGPTLGTSAFFGEYLRLGRLIVVNINVSVTTNGTCGTSWTVTLPTAAAASLSYSVAGRSTTAGTITCGIANGTSVAFCQKYDLGYFSVDGTAVAITGTYEANTN